MLQSANEFGAASTYYLNADLIVDNGQLENDIETLFHSMSKGASVQRIVIDEITAIPHWEMALKRLADQGKLSRALIVTTGSSATDLRRGAEKLPCRKGRLPRTTYLFAPIPYREFKRVCGEALGKKTLVSYLLSGGSPIACTELASNGFIPEFVIELVRDWIDGEIARSGRSRASLLNTINTVFRFGGAPVGQAKLAREAGLSNNTVAAGYINILNDLGIVIPAFPWDQHRKQLVLRKPCKYHFTNLLAAIAYRADSIRSPADFLKLPESTQGIWMEWLVAQELSRRASMAGK